MAARASRLVLRQASQVAGRLTGAPAVPLRRLSTAADDDDVVKAAFVKQQTQFRAYLSELDRVTIPLDPQSDKEVQDYAGALKSIRKKVGIPSFSDKLGGLLEAAAEDTSEVRTFLEEGRKIRTELGIGDSMGAEEEMFKALDEVEKKLGKPLVTSDAKGLQAFQDQITTINSKLGLNDKSLEDLEKEVDLDLAKLEIEAFRKEALEKIDTYKRRDGLENLTVDLKKLDPRAFL